MERTPLVVVDHREPLAMVELLESRAVGVRVEELNLGDYVVHGSVVVERKTAQDLVLSIVDGRLFKQCSRLRIGELRPRVLVEGDPFDTPYRMRERALQGALVALATAWQTPLLPSRSMAESADLLALIGRQDLKVEVRLVRPGPKPKTLASRQAYLLQALPGVGPKRAQAVLAHFGQVGEVFAASAGALAEVPGIGREGARRMRELLESSCPTRPAVGGAAPQQVMPRRCRPVGETLL